MKGLTPDELLDLVEYEKARERYLPRLIAYKHTRRVAVGDTLTFVFENRETLRFQIQEMLRAERTVLEAAIQQDLDAYNELVPGENELSATLMIEIPESQRIREMLDRLVGIDEHVYLDVGDASVRATFDEKQFEQDRISAVQYIRFPLGPELAARFRDPSVAVQLGVDHANYFATTPIVGEARASLAADLA